jgi:hypothetical protein
MEENLVEVPRESVEKAVKQLLKAERIKHWNAQKDAPNGLKSDPYSQLEKEGRLNAEFLLAEAPKIMNKESELPATQRSYIARIMDAAMAKALRWKQQAEAAAAKTDPGAGEGAPAPTDEAAAPADAEKEAPAEQEAPADAAPAESENAEKAEESNEKAQKTDEKPAKSNKKTKK